MMELFRAIESRAQKLLEATAKKHSLGCGTLPRGLGAGDIPSFRLGYFSTHPR